MSRPIKQQKESDSCPQPQQNNGDTYSTGLKYDSDKPDFSLISPLAITELARVLTYGAKKYEPNNWRKGIEHTRIISAMMRHIVAYNAGDDFDGESGLHHMAHAMCCCMFLIELDSAPDYVVKDNRFEYTSYQRMFLTKLLNNNTDSSIPPTI